MRLGIGFGMLTALTGGSARAADGPLLVVVEAPPALDADAAEIRRAIGTELHSRTVAPMKTPAETSDRALIVALDRDRIAMSLRTSDAAPVARSIPAPPEHAARLRAIAWLAGNLARDQVSPIVAEAAKAPPAASLLQPTSPAAPVAPAPAPPASSGHPPPPTARGRRIDRTASVRDSRCNVATRLDRAPARHRAGRSPQRPGRPSHATGRRRALRQSIWLLERRFGIGDVSKVHHDGLASRAPAPRDSSGHGTGRATEGSSGGLRTRSLRGDGLRGLGASSRPLEP